ncbi:MAG: coenzyme F420-0:L-glutamate ligase [Ignavibacteriaceae bacterium]|nr:coenzyme F420-0:L-glutamate ligase [Ignavibacteriaceae bacterium]
MEYKGREYARYPIETPIVNIGDNLNDFIEKYAKPYVKDGDFLCISSKIISISQKFVVHRSEVKISPLARLIVKFVKKWPNDYGYSLPEKMQVAINMVGYPRMILALIGGTLMKLIGKPGYFYRIAGHNINAIDGFIPTAMKPFNEYAFLPPKNADKIAQDLESRFSFPVAIVDGNNIDNNIIGCSEGVSHQFSEADLMQILKGNPQGQDDDGNITPMLVIRML